MTIFKAPCLTGAATITLRTPRSENVGRKELARAFEYDINAARFPWHLLWRRLSGEGDCTATYGQGVLAGLDGLRPTPVHTVELQKMRRCRRSSLDFIDMDDANVC